MRLLLDSLSDKDRGELKILSARGKEVIESSKGLEVALIEIVTQRDNLKAHLNGYLYKRKDDLALKLSSQTSGGNLESEITNLKMEQKHLSTLSSVVTKDITEIETTSEGKKRK